MTVGRKVVSWGGHNINGTIDFDTDILRRTDWPNSPKASSVKTPRPGEYGLHVMGQPETKIGRLEINSLADFADNWTELQGWFDWRLGQQYLVTSDLAGSNLRRMKCFPLECNITEGIETEGDNFGNVVLEAVNPVWESVAADTIADETNVGDGDTFSVDNDGNTRSYPIFTITPTASKADTDGYTLRRRLIMASRTEIPMGDPVKDGGYPVDLTADALDTDALNTATKVRSDLFDLAVSLNGELQNRWPDPSTDNATTKLWTNVAARAMKSATLAANISDADDSLSVTRPYPFDSADWPTRGLKAFVYIGTELVQYASRDAGNLYGLTRGTRGTAAAAHTAGDTVLWVEHPFLDLFYGKSTATDPEPPDDEKPLIDLAASSNTLHVLGSAFLNARDRRSRALRRAHTDAGVGSQHVRQYEDGTSLVFENNQAAAGKPALNDAVMEFPVPLSTTGPTIDANVELTMLLRAYVEDMESYESKLIDQGYTATPLTAQNYPLPAVAKKIRFVGSIGVVVGNTDDSFPGSWNAPSSPGTADVLHPEIEYLQSYQDTAVRFVLQQDTKMTPGVDISISKAVGATGNLEILIMEDASGRPAVDVESGVIKPHIVASAVILEADIVDSTTPVKTPVSFGAAFHIPAGTYWLVLKRAAGLGSGLFYTGMGTGNAVFLTYLGGSIQEAVSLTFSIHSDETDPQDDAPLDNGDVIELANLNFPLESARAPLLALQGEESFYDLRAARLQNDTNGTYIDLTWPMTIDASLYVDTKAHRIVDLETGLDIPFAGVPGNGVWPYNSAGANTWSWTEQGATGLTISIEHRGEWL
jgi:hypothetical protein